MRKMHFTNCPGLKEDKYHADNVSELTCLRCIKKAIKARQGSMYTHYSCELLKIKYGIAKGLIDIVGSNHKSTATSINFKDMVQLHRNAASER